MIRDAWNTLGWRIKAEIEEQFGQGQFMVRRDMVEDAIGYRAASVIDPWTGISRISPENQERMRDVAELIAGHKAYAWLRRGEDTVNDLVSYAKTTIIVRSIKVGIDNILSNLLHLAVMGVPFAKIISGSRDKFAEISAYQGNRQEIQRLQVQLAAVIHDIPRSNALEARIQALEDANARLSIAPLLKAGEFSTISENLTEADVAIREGRWADYIESAVDKLPGWAQGTAKNLLITKDSALFQGLNRMVSYGDFVAKAVLYEHLTEAKGMGKREALDKLIEEFVPYNRLPGRGRDFVRNAGADPLRSTGIFRSSPM